MFKPAQLNAFAAWLVCLWTGSVGAVALIAAPAAFSTLPSKELAGQVAAQLFKTEAYGSLFVAALVWAALRPSFAPSQAEVGEARHASSAKVDWLVWGALLVVLISTVLGYFALVPQMQEVKASLGSASPAYARLHGFSMGLFALKAAAWLLLSGRLIVSLANKR